jgi:hypothetical protein
MLHKAKIYINVVGAGSLKYNAQILAENDKFVQKASDLQLQ